ncbi:MAG TPA: DAK2 domain-containing protein, partial [Mycobacteriales bacterium]|nr:DAK2 domain-containing protein [Mycobacteriales bacterium]
NLLLTLRAAADELSASPVGDAGQALRAMARGAVLGARGNSGVIVSQFLRGLAAELDGSSGFGGRAVAAALGQGEALARAAVRDPVEGTALSVIRAATTAARVRLEEARPGLVREPDELAEVACAAAGAAVDALRRTPEQLDALARAGVVDAAGWGVVLLLGALTEVVTGETAPGRSTGAVPLSAPPSGPAVPADPTELAGLVGGPDHREYGYEVQYLLDATGDQAGALRDRLGRLGDCVAVVAAGDSTWNVHVHVDDVGAAIEAGIDAGRPSRITVEPVDGPSGRAAPAGPPPGAGVAVLAVAPGEGVADLFGAEGVVVVGTGPARIPTVDEVVSAIVGAGAASVIVLPDHGAATAVADRAARATRVRGLRVAVVPTRSPVQGLAAVAVHDQARRFDDDVIAMAEAAAATRWAEVAVAEREALTMAGRCVAGDLLGLAEGDVVLIGRSVRDAAVELADRLLLAGGELVTVITGADAGTGLGRHLERHVTSRYPGVEVRVYHGGQPHHPVILGVE